MLEDAYASLSMCVHGFDHAYVSLSMCTHLESRFDKNIYIFFIIVLIVFHMLVDSI